MKNSQNKVEDNKINETLKNWSKYAKVYDPVKCASIDGTDTEPHDRAVGRAQNSTYKPNRFVKGCPDCTIFVSRLNHETSKETIKELFSKYGKLKRFRMVKDIVTGMPKGYAFVEFEEERAAEEAYRSANKMNVDGNIIFVDFECERLLKGWKPRRLGGGFGGKKESGQLRFGGRDRPFKKPIALELKEKEEKKERDKLKRRREEDRHHQDRSREKIRRRLSPLAKSPQNNHEKQYFHEKDKEISQAPSRKIPRQNSPNKEAKPKEPVLCNEVRRVSPSKENYKRQSSPKYQEKPQDNIQQNLPSKETIKKHIRQNSLQTDKGKNSSQQHTQLRKDTSRYSPIRKTNKISTFSQENRTHTKQRYVSPERKHISPVARSDQLSERGNQRSPVRRMEQRPASPINTREVRHHSPVRDLFRNRKRLSPIRRYDRPTIPEDSPKYRAPIVGRPISPDTNINRRICSSPVRGHFRRESSPREYQPVSSPREIRYRSTSGEEHSQYSDYPNNRFLNERDNSRPYSPQQDSAFPPYHERNDNYSPRREFDERYSQQHHEERQYIHTKVYSERRYEENESSFQPVRRDQQMFETRGNEGGYGNQREWNSKRPPYNRRFPARRGRFRGGFRNY